MIYKNKKTGALYRWLAAGVYHEKSQELQGVAIYCPDNNEHSIAVCKTEEFYELTDDQKEHVVSGGIINDQGETVTPTESEGTPDPAQVNDEPELLARDGKHTIPYSELVEARDKAGQWEQFAAQQAELIKALQAAKVEDAETGGTDAQKAVLEEYQGDYPEVAEDMKPFIQRMIDEGIKQGLSAFQQQISEQLKPVQIIAQESAAEKWLSAVSSAHSDWQAVAADPKLIEWINQQPSFVRDQYNLVLEKGTANQAIELLSAFKQAYPVHKETVPNAKDKAEQVLANIKPNVPNTLTDIPAGKTGTTDISETMLTMSPRQLDELFANKSPEEIQKLIARVV